MTSSAGGQSATDISVVVVNYNTAHLLRELRTTLECSRGELRLHTVIIDNASRDSSETTLRREFPDAKIILNEVNVGFGRANNQALPFLVGRYVLLLNTDAFVSPDTLTKTVAFMDAHPDCGILGVRLIGRDGAVQPSCRSFPRPWHEFLRRTGLDRIFDRRRRTPDMNADHAVTRECDWVPGCYFLIRRQLTDSIGLFDPRYFLYYEEVDYCKAAKSAGWKVVYFADTNVIHLGGESAKSEGELTSSGKQIDELQIESQLLYFRKHLGLVGATLSVLLEGLAGAGSLSKRLLLNRPSPRGGSSVLRFPLVWKAALRTRFGSHPTR